MARKSDIRLRRSAVSGSVPGGADLNLGELALNTADGAIFVKNGAGNIVTVSHDDILHYDEPNSRIGIGTSTPAVDLHVVSGDGSTIGGAYMNRATLLLGTTTAGMAFDVNEICVAGDDLFLETLGNNDIKFRTNGTQVKMIVKGNGNVGVGWSDPKERFSIGNKINFHDGGHKLIAFGFNPSDSNKATGTGYPADLRYDPASGDLRFEIDSTQRANGDVSATSNRLILKGSGDVLVPAGSLGIDVSTPYAKLQVNDTVFDGTHGVHADSRVNIASHGSLQAIQYASTYNSADYPDYGMVFVHGPSTSSYNVWSISPDGPAKGDSLNFIYGSNTSNIHTITPKVVFDGNGNVGIGTETPRAKLDVNGSINVEQATSIALDSDTYTDTAILIPRGTGIRSNTTGDYQRNLLSHNGTTGNGALQIGQQGTSIITDVLVYPGSSGNIRFFPSGSEDVRFASSGNVGIGNINPVARLDVAGEDTGPSSIYDYGYATNDGIRVFGNESAIDIVGNDNGNHASSLLLRNSNEGFALVNNADSNRLEFRSFTATADDFKVHSTGTSVNNLVDILTLEKTGNVGIGTTNPAGKLHVSDAGGAGLEINPQTSNDRVILFAYDRNASTYQSMDFDALDYHFNPSGTEKMRLTNGGNLGIGDINPAHKLTVSAPNNTTAVGIDIGSNAHFDFQANSTSGYTTTFYMDDTGLEIGHDSASRNLALQTSNTDRLVIAGSGAITFNNAYTFPTSIGSSGQILKVPTSGTQLIWGNETSSAPLQIIDTDGDTKIQVEESADEDIIRFDTAGTQRLVIDASGNVLQAGGDLRFTGGINWDIAHHGAGQNIVFHTTPTGGSATRRMRIDDQGNVGIGTDSMTYKFEVHGNLASSLRARVVNAGNGQSSLDLKTADQETRLIAVNGKSFYVYNQTTATEPFTILSGGNVGIDFTSPDDRLHVKGGIRTHSASESKYIKILGGNSGNFIDSHGTTLYIRPGGNTSTATTMDASGNVGIGANLTVAGNLTVQGTTTTLNTATLDVEDLNITVAKGAADKAAADGAGITIDCGSDTNATFTYDATNDRFNFDREIHTSNGIRIQHASPYLVLKDTSDDDDHAIRLTASDNSTVYQIDSAGDNFNFRTYGTRGINLLTGNIQRFSVGDGGNVHFYTADGTSSRMRWDATNEKLIFGQGDRLSLDTAVTINPSNGTQKVYSLISSDIGSENLAFAMKGDDTTDRMSFFTDYNTSGTYAERMSIIAETGRVGINQSTPAAQFHVYSNTTSAPAMLIRNDSASAGGRGLLIQHDNGGAGTDRYALKVVTAFGSSDVNALVVDGNSHVGIGTDTPSEKLHVAGKILAGGQIRSSSYLEDYPSFSFANDTDTGMFSDTANQLEFSTGGSSRVTINSSGNVGIGEANPNGKLVVRGANYAANQDGGIIIQAGARDSSHWQSGFKIKSDGSGNARTAIDATTGAIAGTLAERISIDTAGKVGIGTTGPSKPLHVQFSGDHGVRIESEDNHASLYVDSHTGHAQYIRFSENNAGKYWIQSTGGKLVFRPGGTSTVANQVTFDSTGKVGIGTNSPAFKLDVQEANGNALARFKDSDSSHSGIVIAGDVNAGWVGNDVGVTGEGIYYQSSNNFMRFYTNSSEQMRIDNSGRLLVNATSTVFNDKLYIGGDGYATGGWRTGTGATFVGELTNLSGKLALQSDASRDIQLGDTNNPDIVYIDTSAQNVGIGTNTPDTKLDITSDGVQGIIMNQDTTNTSASARLFFKDAVRTNTILNVSGNLEFRTGASLGSTSGTVRMFVATNRVQTNVPLRVEEYQIDTTTSSTAATTQAAIHTFPIANFRSARFTIQITNTTDSTYHSTEILAIHDGTTANITEFGEVHTGSSVEATFDADINSGNFRLLATPTSTNSMTFKVVCHSLTV